MKNLIKLSKYNISLTCTNIEYTKNICASHVEIDAVNIHMKPRDLKQGHYSTKCICIINSFDMKHNKKL